MNALKKGACQQNTATLPLAQRGGDTLIRVALVARPSGKAIDPTTLDALRVSVKSEQSPQCATIPYTISNGELVVEVTADISRLLGLGLYTLIVTGRTPDKDYADGYHDYEIVAPLCKVVKIATEATTDGITAQALEALRGERGLSAYELAVQEGFTGTLQEWLKSLTPVVPTPAPAGDVVSLEEFNKLKATVNSLSVQQIPEDKIKAILSIIDNMFMLTSVTIDSYTKNLGDYEVSEAIKPYRDKMINGVLTLLNRDASNGDSVKEAENLIPSSDSAEKLFGAISEYVVDVLRQSQGQTNP